MTQEDVEMAVIGHMTSDPDDARLVLASGIDQEHFVHTVGNDKGSITRLLFRLAVEYLKEHDRLLSPDALDRLAKLKGFSMKRGQVGSRLMSLLVRCSGGPPDRNALPALLADLEYRRQCRALVEVGDRVRAAIKDGDASGAIDAAYEVLHAERTRRNQRAGGRHGFVTLGRAGEWIGDQTWLWPGWVPFGHLTLIFGAPEVGKTFLAQAIALVVTGQVDRFPDGSTVDATGTVLWVDYEGQIGTLHNRIREAGCGPDSILVLDLSDPGSQTPSLFKKTKGGEALEICSVIANARETFTDLRMVVIDSLFGGTNGEDENKAAVAAPLVQLAELSSRLGLAIVVLHHPRKPHDDGDDTSVPVHTINLSSVRGNSSIGGVPRSIIAIDRPVDSDVRRMRLVKASLIAERPSPLGFSIEEARIVPQPVPVRPEVRTRTQECEAWLVALLREGPMLQRRVEELAGDAGFSPRMLKDVAKPPLVVKAPVQVSEPGEPYRKAWRWELG